METDTSPNSNSIPVTEIYYIYICIYYHIYIYIYYRVLHISPFETEIKIFWSEAKIEASTKPLPEYFLNASRLTKDARGSFFYTHCRYRVYN